MSARAFLRRFVLSSLAPMAFMAVALPGCGSDTVTGLPVGASSGNTPVVGGVCDPTTGATACVGQAVLACTPAGTWIVHQSCSTGQKCVQAGPDGATATCVGSAADAGGDGGGEWDAGSGSDAGSGLDATLADATDSSDAGPTLDGTTTGGNCTTYQDVQAIFLNNCNGCHNHKFGDACNMAANYPLIAARVQSGSMPPGGGLGASDKALVAAWAAGHAVCTPDLCPGADAGSTADAGANPDTTLDDAVGPDTLADTITIADTSAGDTGGPTCIGFAAVKPVFANNCSGGGCHSFQNTCPGPSGKYSSTNIGNAVQAGVMPPGGGISAADQATIAAWVQGGATCNCPTVGPDAGSTDTVGPGPDTTSGDTIGADTVGPGPDGGTTTPATCGNLQCDAGETAANCPSDCGAENTCILSNCQQQANSCINSTSCHGAFACQQACAAGDTACLQACLAGKSNKTKNNLNNLNTCIANAKCTSGGGGTTTGNVCDAACGAQGGTVGGKACYCDAACAQYGDCCNAAGTGMGATCGGSTCTQCNGGVTPPPNTCGNGTCDAGETTANCPADCPPAPAVCGNGVCETGETTATCPADCPAKTCTTYADVQQILLQNCNGCHGHTFGNSCAATSGRNIAGYVASGAMPTNKTLSAADKAKIAAWAAANNACTTAQCP